MGVLADERQEAYQLSGHAQKGKVSCHREHLGCGLDRGYDTSTERMGVLLVSRSTFDEVIHALDVAVVEERDDRRSNYPLLWVDVADDD